MGILTISLFFLSISFHELGHALAMRKYNIKLDRMSILGFGPVLFSFKWRKVFGETPLEIRTIPLGAFVTPSSNFSLYRLTYKQYSHIMFAGCSMNFLFAVVLNCISLLFVPILTTKFLIINIICLLLGLFPRRLFAVGVFISLFCCVGFFSSVLADIFANTLQVEEYGSVVTISKEAVKHSQTIAESLNYAAIISIGLGIVNCFPLFPLDGGRIVLRTLYLPTFKTKMLRKIFVYSSTCLLLLLLALSFFGELKTIFSLF